MDRIAYLTRLAAGRSVIHVGFAGETRATIDDLRNNPLWLHGALGGSATRLVGLDLDAASVERARAAGFEAHRADAADAASLSALDLEPADLVIAGEVIEHVERPGELLDALHLLVAPGGRLAITTPNAASLLNPLAAAARYELINPDHVSFYSWYTLGNVMERHGWRVRRFLTYHFPFAGEAWAGGGAAAAGRAMARVQATLSRWWPYLDFGLIAVADSGR